MEIGQRLRVIEPPDLRHEPCDKLDTAVGALGETAQDFAGIRTFVAIAPFIKKALGARGVFGWRQIQESQEIARLVMGTLLFKFFTAFQVNQGRRRRARRALGISAGVMTLRLDEAIPA